jgi:TnpA family transposase
MGQFYASLELEHVTASTAMRKLNALSRKDHFYRANREFGRDFRYGKRGKEDKSDIQEQRNSCNCLTLILASVVYWQAKKMNRVVIEY